MSIENTVLSIFYKVYELVKILNYTLLGKKRTFQVCPLEGIAKKCSFKTAHSLLVYMKFDSVLEIC